MKMYHKDSKGSVDVHPSQIENMRSKGWTEKPQPEPIDEPETQPQEVI